MTSLQLVTSQRCGCASASAGAGVSRCSGVLGAAVRFLWFDVYGEEVRKGRSHPLAPGNKQTCQRGEVWPGAPRFFTFH